MELLENPTKEFLAGGQIIRDLRESLHHDHIYVSDGKSGQEFSRFFTNFLQQDQPVRAYRLRRRAEAKSTPVSSSARSVVLNSMPASPELRPGEAVGSSC